MEPTECRLALGRVVVKVVAVGQEVLLPPVPGHTEARALQTYLCINQRHGIPLIQ